MKDRKIVGERMKAHVAAQDTTPLLIFPEGTCVNNEYCVMFKRGAFDLDATVCPIAIKYNKIFVDAFWNSRRQSFTAHLVRAIMHSWLMCCGGYHKRCKRAWQCWRDRLCSYAVLCCWAFWVEVVHVLKNAFPRYASSLVANATSQK